MKKSAIFFPTLDCTFQIVNRKHSQTFVFIMSPHTHSHIHNHNGLTHFSVPKWTRKSNCSHRSVCVCPVKPFVVISLVNRMINLRA